MAGSGGRSAWPGLGVTSRNTTDVTPTPGLPRPPTLLATLARLPSCFLTRDLPIHWAALARSLPLLDYSFFLIKI